MLRAAVAAVVFVFATGTLAVAQPAEQKQGRGEPRSARPAPQAAPQRQWAEQPRRESAPVRQRAERAPRAVERPRKRTAEPRRERREVQRPERRAGERLERRQSADEQRSRRRHAQAAEERRSTARRQADERRKAAETKRQATEERRETAERKRQAAEERQRQAGRAKEVNKDKARSAERDSKQDGAKQERRAEKHKEIREERAKLSREQRQRLRGAFRFNRDRVSRVHFRARIGTHVPRRARLWLIPAAVYEVFPHYRDYRYVIVDETICIVDPDTYEVVDVLERGPAGPRQEVAELTLTSGERRIVRDSIPRDFPVAGVELRLALGAQIPPDVDLHEFAPEVLDQVPELQSFRFVVAADRIVIVDPDDRSVALVVDR